MALGYAAHAYLVKAYLRTSSGAVIAEPDTVVLILIWRWRSPTAINTMRQALPSMRWTKTARCWRLSAGEPWHGRAAANGAGHGREAGPFRRLRRFSAMIRNVSAAEDRNGSAAATDTDLRCSVTNRGVSHHTAACASAGTEHGLPATPAPPRPRGRAPHAWRRRAGGPPWRWRRQPLG